MNPSDDIRVQLTADGSHTLMNTRLDESYHAHNGAISESVHVYIHAGLEEVAKQHSRIRILEFGFGTGLNAILTQQRAAQLGLKVEYTSIEPMPIGPDIIEQLNYKEHLAPESGPLFDDIHKAPWNRNSEITPNFMVHKFEGKLADFPLLEDKFDLIYFDAFAPSRQPDAWSLANLAKCFEALAPGGLLVTYCANGQFKRDMKSLGFQVKAYPGALGRREMTRAWKSTLVEDVETEKVS